MLGIGLERLFRSPGQVSVLRALWKAPAPLTGRQVQQLAGLHNLTTTRCLEHLEGLGLVQRRTAGRAYLYSLNRRHRLVRHLINAVFKAEEAVPARFARELRAVLGGQCLSVILYGSVVRGHAESAGDVDLLIVVEDKEAAERFAAKTLAAMEKLVRDGWGLMPEVNLKTRPEVAKQWNSPLLRRIRQEGLLLAGLPLAEVRDGRHP